MAVDPTDLDARLRRLEDIEEIRRLRMSYHHLINEGRAEEVAGLYTDDAYVEYEGVVIARGRAEFGRAIPGLSRRLTFIKQFMANHMVEVDGDTATGVAYLDARYAHEGQSIMATARFTETYRRTAAGWRISEMICRTYFNVPIEQGWAGAGLQNFVPLTEAEIAAGEARK
jgi:ketosteroid isomerase-like protein